MKLRMGVLGIDPGIKNTGVAILDNQQRLVFAKTYARADIHKITRDLNGYLFTLVAIEEPFLGRNARDYGETKEVIGILIGRLMRDGYVLQQDIYRTTPKEGNTVMGLTDKSKINTDKRKRDAAQEIWGGRMAAIEGTVNITDGHQASAVAAAFIVQRKLYMEMNKEYETNE